MHANNDPNTAYLRLLLVLDCEYDPVTREGRQNYCPDGRRLVPIDLSVPDELADIQRFRTRTGTVYWVLRTKKRKYDDAGGEDDYEIWRIAGAFKTTSLKQGGKYPVYSRISEDEMTSLILEVTAV